MSRRTKIRVALVLFGSLGLSTAAFGADGAALYKAQCAKCHGAEGKSDTKTGKAMKVPALADPKIQKMSAEEIVKLTKAAAKHSKAVKAVSDADAAAIAQTVKTFGAAK